MSGATAPICYGCTRYGLGGPQLNPKAEIAPQDRVWQCPNRVTEFPTAENAST